MSDQREFIEAVYRKRKEAVRFFSNAAKPERERWVVSEFLSGLGVTFQEHELVSPEQDDAVDVQFRDAKFQVKEITDPALRRGDEVRADLRRAQHAENIGELFEVGTPVDTVLSNACLLMRDVAESAKYPPLVRARLDLLFYVTRARAGLGSEEDKQKLAAAGWRSISCLYGSRSVLLSATKAAPAFLRC